MFLLTKAGYESQRIKKWSHGKGKSVTGNEGLRDSINAAHATQSDFLSFNNYVGELECKQKVKSGTGLTRGHLSRERCTTWIPEQE